MKSLGYEIHVDWFGDGMFPHVLAEALGVLGYLPDVIEGGPFAPLSAMTFWCKTAKEFKPVSRQTQSLLSSYRACTWYAEAEVVRECQRIRGNVQFDHNVELPMTIRLTPQTSDHDRRPSEFHLSFSCGRVDPALVGKLVMGLDCYPARFQRESGTNLVLTVQGEHDEIEQVVPVLASFLSKCGGFEEAQLKVENVVWFRRGAREVQVPPRIRSLTI
jgi:hypothetical protein